MIDTVCCLEFQLSQEDGRLVDELILRYFTDSIVQVFCHFQSEVKNLSLEILVVLFLRWEEI